MYKEKFGDLIQDAINNEYDAIIHGCNCFCCMGAGIAATIRNNFPEAFYTDVKTANGSYNKLGTLSIAKTQNNVYVINAYTQFQPGKFGNKNAILMCLDKTAYIMQKWQLKHIGMPLIGCGIAGLDENEMVPIYKNWAAINSFDVTLVRFKND